MAVSKIPMSKKDTRIIRLGIAGNSTNVIQFPTETVHAIIAIYRGAVSSYKIVLIDYLANATTIMEHGIGTEVSVSGDSNGNITLQNSSGTAMFGVAIFA